VENIKISQLSKLFLAGFISVAISCNNAKKPRYSIPEQYYTGKVRENLDKMLMQGQLLFKEHCSKCHGIFTKGKDSIPNFSKTQIENYESKILYDDQDNHGVLQKITAEELDRILDFLKFRTQADTTKKK
jgi:cytochrome c553